MMKKALLLSFVFAFLSLAGFAQDKKVTGKVTDSGGNSLPGVSVQVKGTAKGTQTDANGAYSIDASNNATLVFSFIGMASQEIAVGNKTSINATLADDAKTLSEVVVVAQGIKRDKKALGYAATIVNAKDIAQKPETDLGRALAGRTPGIQIAAASGLAGTGTKINIRGISSVSGNTQPLWIVDGVPINTATNENNDFRDGNITPTRSLDLDPNNVESMNILRGLSATTLYGSAGRNGVILVTTKGGSTGKDDQRQFSGSLSHSYNQVEAHVPDYQNVWGNGFDGDYGEFFSNWGSLFENPNITWRHPYYEHRALFPEYPEFATAATSGYTPKAVPNNIKDFFQKGLSNNTSLNLGLRSKGLSMNVNYSHLDESGYIKNNNLTRDNFNLGGSADLTKKWNVSATFNYVKTDFKTPPIGAGQGSNSAGGPSVFANLFYVPRNIDLMNWPYQNPVTGASLYYRNGNDVTNPRWLLDNAAQTSATDRFFGTLQTGYQLNDWLRVSYRLGLDTYTERQAYYVNRGAVGFPTTASIFATGFLRNTTGVNSVRDHSLIATMNKKFGNDIDITANIGANGRFDSYDQSGMESSNQVVFGLITPRNFINATQKDFRTNSLNEVENSALLGAFVDATFGYKDYLFVNVQGRNDWSSNHEPEYRSLFYPGGSVSFVPTTAFPNFKSNILDFLKVRFGYGTSANFAKPYSTRRYLAIDALKTVDSRGSVTTLSLSELLSNPGLRPELLKETEAGLEAKLFRGRIGFDLSVYSRLAEDQILKRPLDRSTGYIETYINAGSISNKGIELGLDVTPIKIGDFSWNVRANFTKNVSKVESLPEGSKEILVSGYTNLGNFAIEGQPFNVIKGTYVVKNDKGELMVTENGDWEISTETGIIADPNPKFLLTGITELKYKNFSIGGHVDYVHGGQIFSYTAAGLVGRGVAAEIADVANPELPIILPGVKPDGQVNDIPMPASGLFFGNNIIGGGANDRGVFDATRVRLREVSLSYDVPSKLLKGSPVKGISVSLIGNNLWYRAVNTPKSSKVDADRTAFGADNGAGFDFLGGPSAARYGGSIKFNF